MFVLAFFYDSGYASRLNLSAGPLRDSEIGEWKFRINRGTYEISVGRRMFKCALLGVHFIIAKIIRRFRTKARPGAVK